MYTALVFVHAQSSERGAFPAAFRPWQGSPLKSLGGAALVGSLDRGVEHLLKLLFGKLQHGSGGVVPYRKWVFKDGSGHVV